MDAPKCKICGVAHWSNQPHVGLTKGQALVVAKKSTAVRKDAHAREEGRTATSRVVGVKVAGEISARSRNQALPVDTDSHAKASKAKPAAGKAKARKGDASRPSRGGGSPAEKFQKRSGTARKASGGPAPRKGIAGPDRAPGISSEGKPAPDLLPVRASKQGAKPAATHSSNAPAGRSALEGGKRLAKKAGHATRPAPKVSAVPDGGSTKKPKLKRGRPSTGFDKKAYQRDLMRDRRAKAKEAKT